MSSLTVKQEKLQCKQHKDLFSQIGTQQATINDIADTQRIQLQEIKRMSIIISKQQEVIENRDSAISQLADQLLHLQKQVNLLQKIQKNDTTIINEKMNAKKCIELNTNIGRQQQKQMESHQNDLQDITSQLSKLDTTQKEISSLTQTKIDTHTCIEIVNNKQHSYQNRTQKHEDQTNKSILNLMASQERSNLQMESHQNDLQDITSQLSKLDTTQKEISSLIQTKIDTHSCMEIINNKQHSCQNRTQKHEDQTNKSILNLMASQERSNIHKTSTNKTRKCHTKTTINGTSILIANIKSRQDPNIISQAFCHEFQIPQICLANSQTSWIRNGRLRIDMKNPRLAANIRKAIAYQMKIKTLQQGYVSYMFQRCYMPQKFIINNQHPGTRQRWSGQQTTERVTDQTKNLQ
jgi:hypothetical protein